MTVLPLNNDKSIQINPNLGIILAGDMEGWFMERYINIFMNGYIVDYVDNVNYEGVIEFKRSYSYQDVLELGIISIIEKEITQGNYMHMWVDEIAVPYSVRYQRNHFVHPLMVYGFDHERQICKTVFFDIRKGQIEADIRYSDLIESIQYAGRYYGEGGTEDAVINTVSSYKLSDYLKCSFHPDVFLRQLSNYLCGKSENLTEWYTMKRPEVFDSDSNIFGIQVYLRLIDCLNSKETRYNINYKTIHDFITHKKLLSDRFMYLKNNYDMSEQYSNLVEKFADNYRTLEKMRLLNMKKQMSFGLFPASLCFEKDYINTLVKTLSECYRTEMKIVPQIYDCLLKAAYTQKYFQQNNIIVLQSKEAKKYDNYIEFDVSSYDIYTSRIDIVRSEKCIENDSFEYIVINDNLKYYLERDSNEHIPIRTVCFPPVKKVNKLCLFTDAEQCEYTVYVYSLFSRDGSETVQVAADGSWTSFNDLRRAESFGAGMNLLLYGEDPFLISKKLTVKADEFPYLHIRMSSSAKTIYAQVFFTTYDNPNISMEKSLFFRIIPDGLMHSYFVNMTKNHLWNGVVRELRIDPAQYHGIYKWEEGKEEICTIEKIEFIKNKPDGASECEVAKKLN